MSGGFLNVVLLVPVFLFSLCFHEFAHAWVAVKRGDSTPADQGRLTMHPMAHADILGTFILPILAIYTGAPFFGWAKPVPVDARNFKYGRRDMALVAAAGPLSNILLSLFSTALLYTLLRIPYTHAVIETITTFTVISIQVNLMLAFFNLIPIAPLDGFMVLQGFLSARIAVRLHRLARYSGLIFLILLFTGGFRIISWPVRILTAYLIHFAGVS